MAMVLAHIAGIPVEETVLALGSAGVAGIGTALRLIDVKRRRSRWMAAHSNRSTKASTRSNG
jgi:hypothetical protein